MDRVVRKMSKWPKFVTAIRSFILFYAVQSSLIDDLSTRSERRTLSDTRASSYPHLKRDLSALRRTPKNLICTALERSQGRLWRKNVQASMRDRIHSGYSLQLQNYPGLNESPGTIHRLLRRATLLAVRRFRNKLIPRRLNLQQWPVWKKLKCKPSSSALSNRKVPEQIFKAHVSARKVGYLFNCLLIYLSTFTLIWWTCPECSQCTKGNLGNKIETSTPKIM